MRKLLAIEGIHHPKADVDRLYIERRSDGRGLVKLHSAYNVAIVLSEFIKQSKDRLTGLVQDNDADKIKYSL
jgi:hypothetical protein